ncbi:uncharacterized protein LOC143461946 [Clavelina lepadiformis]|uniref:uncharacterized protein LOC143461946 n=1 Tax=Clavelina lepadiformis TaxID=159417 RepID=UPI0040429BB8
MLNCHCLSSHSWKWALGAIVVAGGGIAVCKYAKKRYQQMQHKTKGETDNPYESIKLLNEYLAFHYGGPAVNCLFDGPMNGFDFPKRCAEICLKYFEPTDIVPKRALDIGCAVGRSTFELASGFLDVVGIDYSHGFIKTCDVLKQNGKMEYEITTEGVLTSRHEAVISANIERSRCRFQQGDACNLPLDLGKFGCVLAANLICRLPRPADFILRLSSLVAPGGICVITSPYTFLEDYTPKGKWLGGYTNNDGTEVRGFDTLKKLFAPNFDLLDTLDEPFLIRETVRKHQWTVAHVTIWKRKSN